MKIIITALLLALSAIPASATQRVCYDSAAPTVVTAIGKTTPAPGEVCFDSGDIDDHENNHYTIDTTGPSPVVIRKSAAAIATIDATRAATAKANRRAKKAEAELAAKGWTAGELTRRLSGGLAILARVVIALADGLPPATTDMATLRALEPELARYEISSPNLVLTVKQLADARAEVGAAIAADRDPDLKAVKKAKEIKD